MKVAVTGASGTIGQALVGALKGRGDQVVVLTRNPESARTKLGDDVDAVEWRDPTSSPAPEAAFDGVDAVVHLAGERVDQRWNDDAKRRIESSRSEGTRNLVAGMKDAGAQLKTLVSASASGYYGPRGDEKVTEAEPAGTDFLSEVVAGWEREAQKAEELGVRVVSLRTGIVLSPEGGALSKMLTPFKLGVGGPIAGGKQYMPWIHIADVVGVYLFALDNDSVSGPVNLSAPDPATNKEFSKQLGKVLHRPAFAPVPKLAIKTLFGEMSTIVVDGVRMVPAALLAAGYEFAQPDLASALADVVG